MHVPGGSGREPRNQEGGRQRPGDQQPESAGWGGSRNRRGRLSATSHRSCSSSHRRRVFPPPTCDSSANTGGRSEVEQGAGPAPKPVTASDFALWEAVSCSDRILPTLRLPCWVETHAATWRGSGVFAREGDGVCVPVGEVGSSLRQVRSQHYGPGAHRILGNSKAGCFKPLCFGEVWSYSDGKLKQS